MNHLSTDITQKHKSGKKVLTNKPFSTIIDEWSIYISACVLASMVNKLLFLITSMPKFTLYSIYFIYLQLKNRILKPLWSYTLITISFVNFFRIPSITVLYSLLRLKQVVCADSSEMNCIINASSSCSKC